MDNGGCVLRQLDIRVFLSDAYPTTTTLSVERMVSILLSQTRLTRKEVNLQPVHHTVGSALARPAAFNNPLERIFPNVSQ